MTRRLAAALTLAFALASPVPALAHAGFESSDPADGSSVPASPERIDIVFTEAPDVGLSRMTVVDAGGVEHPIGPLEAAPPRGLAAPVDEPLPDGVYTVRWQVVSTEDGHVTAGAFAFAVGDAAPPAAGAGPSTIVTRPSPGSIAAKTALTAGYGVLIACAVVGLGTLGGRPRRLHVVALIAALAAFAGAMGLLVVERAAVDVPMADLLASPTGRPYLLLVVASLMAAAAAVLAAARPGWRRLLWLAGAAAAAMALIRATSGHAAAATNPVPQEMTQWFHMLAASLWIGGLPLLALALREPDPPPVTHVRRYSSLAFGAVMVLVATGVVRTITEVGGLGSLIDALGEGYATVLVVKIGLAVALIALGAVNRRRTIPRLADDPTPLRRILVAELALATGVVVLTAALTGLDPAGASAQAAPQEAVLGVAEGTDFARTTHVALTTTPGTPGANALRAVISDPATGEALAPDDVRLRFVSVTVPGSEAVDVAMRPEGEAWVGQGLVPAAAGTWTVTAQVLTGSDAAEVPMTLVTRSDASAPPVPGSPVTTASYPSGVSVQVSVEDAEGTDAYVHVTAFAPDGSDLDLQNATVVAFRDGVSPTRLETELAGPGHAIATATFEAGVWTVDAVVVLADGRAFQATVVRVPIAA